MSIIITYQIFDSFVCSCFGSTDCNEQCTESLWIEFDRKQNVYGFQNDAKISEITENGCNFN